MLFFHPGYTEHAVILLGDKKVGKEAENLRSSLVRTPDACRDFVESVSALVSKSFMQVVYGPRPLCLKMDLKHLAGLWHIRQLFIKVHGMAYK